MSKNLAYCVHLCQMDLQDYSSNRVQTYLQYACMAYRELNLYATTNVKVAYIYPNAALQADLPMDFDYYTKIAVNIQGQLWTLTVNKDLALNHKLSNCGLPIQDLGRVNNPEEFFGSFIDGRWQYAPSFRDGQFVGEMYSLGGGWNDLGYYRIDKELNRIQFNSVVPQTQIVLEYVSSGADQGEATVIPAAAAAVIRAYIHWQLVEFDRTVPMGEKERKRGQYYSEFERFKLAPTIPTMDEYLDSTYEGYKLTPKR